MLSELTEAYAACLQALENGGELEAVLTDYQELADELRPLLHYALAIQSVGRVAPTPSAQALRASRLQMLKRYEATRPKQSWVYFQRWPAAVASGVTLIVLILSGYGIVQASAPSVPGDTLYPIKRTAEQIRLWLSFNVNHQQALENEFEAERLEEIRSLNSQGRVAAIEFSGPIEGLTDNGWQIAGITVKLSVATRIEGLPQIHALAEVHGILQVDGTVLAETIHIEEVEESPELDDTAMPIVPTTQLAPVASLTPTASATPQPSPTSAPTTSNATQAPTPVAPSATLPHPTLVPTYTPTHFVTELEFTGMVQSIMGEVWRIADYELTVTANTELNGNPQVGQWVEVHAVWENGQWIARQIERKDEPPPLQTSQPTSVTPSPSRTHEPSETPEPTEPPESSETPRP